jgi:hypothetical protein
MLRAVLLAIGGVAVTIVAALALLLLINPFDDTPHPSDAAMMAQFARERPALETLVKMAEEDAPMQRIAPDFTRPDPAPLAPERLADYRRRLAAAGIAHGLSHYGDEVTFIVSTMGLGISGSGKSFVHATQQPDDAVLVDGDLDAAASDPANRDARLWRRLAPDWWLELDRR